VPALAVVPNPDSPSERSGSRLTTLEVALVNNMSEGAVRQTERLFTRLLDSASGGPAIEIRHYRPRVRDADGSTEELPFGYAPLDELFERGADAVVVTGAEPLCERLTEEESWAEQRHLLEWIADNERPAFLSCLAAHAALFVYDGIERKRLPAKCSGVFPQQAERHHALGRGLPESVEMPHSRYNDVPLELLVGAGYEPVLHSREVGWTIASRRLGGSLLVLAQGHPEYSGTILLREYRRDVARYLDGSRKELPVLPRRCIEGPRAVALRRFHEQLTSVVRSPSLLDDFPVDISTVHVRAPWTLPAARLVGNWLETLTPAGSSERSRTSRKTG
jgi:homoserine O-succinyltransferase/O-acetyltransferase